MEHIFLETMPKHMKNKKKVDTNWQEFIRHWQTTAFCDAVTGSMN